MSKSKTTFEDVIDFLNKNELTLIQRNELINQFIKSINGFSVDEVIRLDNRGVMYINDKPLTPEEVQNFRNSVQAFRSNIAFKIIADQVMYKAIKKGLHDSVSIEDQYFSKSALFFMELFKQYISKFD